MNNQMLFSNVLSFFIAFLITVSLTPLMKKIAIKYNIVDVPNQRKVHVKNTPYLGGVAIFLGSIISIVFFAKPDTKIVIPIMVLALTAILIMGLIDDIKDLPAKVRLFFLFITAIVIVFAFQLSKYGSPLTEFKFLNLIILIVLIIWLVGLTNAINWSDGMDGLATSESLISIIGFSVLLIIQNRAQLSLPISLSLAGALLGFLPYNIFPAKIFMGDAGSMYIGFFLGILSIISINNETSYLALIVPIYIVFIPVVDMFIVMARRKINGRSMMSADKTHFHHILNKKFNNQKKVVFFISLIQLIFVIGGIVLYFFKLFLLGWIIFLVLVFIILVSLVINKNKIL